MMYLFDASSLLAAVKAGRLDLLAGGRVHWLTLYEVCNALWREARLVGRLTGEEAVRVVEQTQTIASSHKGSRFDKGRTGIRDGGERTQEGERFEATTTGWRPSCSCGVPISENVPAIVLDPYMGSGTTALVAYALGRGYVGIELNPQYAAMAKARLRAEAEQFGLWER